MVDNSYIVWCIESMRDGVECGESLLCFVLMVGIFMLVVLQMVVVGEEFGAVDDMMDDIGAFVQVVRQQMVGETLRCDVVCFVVQGCTMIDEVMRISNQFED